MPTYRIAVVAVVTAAAAADEEFAHTDGEIRLEMVVKR